MLFDGVSSILPTSIFSDFSNFAHGLLDEIKRSRVDNMSSGVNVRAKDYIAFFPIVFSEELLNKKDFTEEILLALELQYARYLEIILNNQQFVRVSNMNDFRNFLRSNGIGRYEAELFNNMNLFESSDNFTAFDIKYEKSMLYFFKPHYAENLDLINEASGKNTSNTSGGGNAYIDDYIEDRPRNRGNDGIRELTTSLSTSSQHSSMDPASENFIRKYSKRPPLIVKYTLGAVFPPSPGDPSGVRVSQFNLSIGVKVVPHVINSDNIIENLGKTVKTNFPLFKLIQLTTGEIKFFKDYVANYDELRKNATEAGRDRHGQKNIWFNLKYLKQKTRMRYLFSHFSQPIIPNTSIILSVSEVDEIKNRYNVDFMNPRFTRQVFKNFYIFSLLVIDDARDLIYQFDSDDVRWKKLYRSDFGSSDNVRELTNALFAAVRR